jgi:hypothetical protein
LKCRVTRRSRAELAALPAAVHELVDSSSPMTSGGRSTVLSPAETVNGR